MSDPSPISTMLLWMLPGLAVLCAGAAMLRLRASNTLGRLIRAGCVCIMIGAGLTSAMLGLPVLAWLVPLSVAAACAIQMLAGSPSLVRLSVQVVRPRSFGMALLAAGPLLLAGGAWKLNEALAPQIVALNDIADQPNPDLIEAADSHAYTDQGRPIPLFTIDPANADQFTRTMMKTLQNNPALPYSAIRRSNVDPVYNCQGWVFLGGNYWIRCREIETILSDNAYSPTNKPVAGDVAIYRDGDGVIIHAGLVAAVTIDGQTLIQSKWGAQGLYLHLPEATPYASDPTFYRTSRPDHHLHVSIHSSEQPPAKTAPGAN